MNSKGKVEREKGKGDAPALWVLTGILILMFVCALFGAYKANAETMRAAGLDVWTIRLISVDYDKGEVTLRIIDLDALIRSHNLKLDQINALKRATCI